MIKHTLLSLSLLMFVSCGADGHDHTTPANGTNNAGTATGQEESGHGTPHPLGKLTAFGRECSVVQFGDIKAGEEGAIELEFASAKERLTTVRSWIGIESGEGSTKAKLDIEDTANMHGHLDVPSPIPANSKLWLSFELDGKTEVHSVAYHQ